MMNYIEFETAIDSFRESNQQLKNTSNTQGIQSGLYILTDFELHKNYEVGGCIIFKSEQKSINSNTFSNISKVQVPDWLKNHKNEEHASACFVLVLSTLMSLSTERSVKFHRDFYNIGGFESVAIYHPLQSSGPGAIDRPSIVSVESMMGNFKEIFLLVNNLGHEDYKIFIRSCRLFQLAQHTKYIDHNLSYSLMVSSIESNATKAITIEEIKTDWKEIKKRIKKVAEEADLDADFRSLLITKLEQHYSALRFQKFMIEYAPLSSLDLESRYDKMDLLPDEKAAFEPMDIKIDPVNNFIHEFRNHPDFLTIFKMKTDIGFDRILKNSYTYRSEFYHEGKANQHNSPDNYDRYVKTIDVRDKKPITIATFSLLAQIARISSVNYYKKLVTTPTPLQNPQKLHNRADL